jgi:hypothetical protein
MVGCWWDNGLSFAHTKKRRNLIGNELEIVALACAPCHAKLEIMPEKRMTDVILTVIGNRVVQP